MRRLARTVTMSAKNRRIAAAGLGCLLLAAGCLPIGPVEIDRVVPGVVEPGDRMDLVGHHFGTSPETARVVVAGTAVPDDHVLSWTAERIELVLPATVDVRPDAQVQVFLHDQKTLPVPVSIVDPGTLQARILAYGDSLTWGQDGAFGSYVSMLETLLWDQGFPCSIVNAGVPGETTGEGLERIGSVLAAWSHVDFLLLLEGTNDVADTNGIPLNESVENLRGMIRHARDVHGIPSLVATPIPRVGGGGDVLSPTTEELVAALHDGLSGEAEAIADLYTTFLTTPDWEACYRDPVHPNTRGNLLMARTWQQELWGSGLAR